MTEEIHAFIDVQDVKTITAPFFKEGEGVIIRKFTYADRQALSGEYLKLSADWDRGKGEKMRPDVVKSEIILDKINLSILDKGIESWTLYDRDGNEVPYSRSNVRKLSEPYAEFILQEINAFNPTRSSEEETGDFF